jgi:hypothetical protein
MRYDHLNQRRYLPVDTASHAEGVTPYTYCYLTAASELPDFHHGVAQALALTAS